MSNRYLYDPQFYGLRIHHHAYTRILCDAMTLLPLQRLLALAGLFALLFSVAFSLPVAAQSGSGGIHVQVFSAETSRPISGVSITVKSRDGAVNSATSDESGMVILEPLEVGLYELEASKTGLVKGFEPEIRVTSRKANFIRMELQAISAGQLEEIVVLARARSASPYGAISASIMNREELRSAVGSGSDVMRALDGMPGLFSSGAFANFTVRGRGPRDNLIYVDGLPFDKVVHFDQTLGEEEDIGGGGRFSIFAPSSVNSAEFSPGGWSAEYGGRSGSLLELEVVDGGPTPSASLRLDIAGVELAYDGPSGFHDDTSVFITARRFDFGNVFDLIGDNDIGTPTLTDIVIKTVTDINDSNTFEVLTIMAPEEYERNIDNVLNSANFEDVDLLKSEQDLGLLGLTWRSLVGDTGEWINRIYGRYSDKTSSQGEAFPNSVPEGTVPDMIPVREDIITIGEQETEFGWRSDYTTLNTLGSFGAGVHLRQVEVDYTTLLDADWIRFVYRTTDPRTPGQDYIVLTPENINSAYQAKESSYAGYAEQVFEFGNWDLRTGLRYDYEGFSGESLFSPRLAANYRYSPELSFSATAGVFYQSPRHLVRASNPDNFDLGSERIGHLSLGLERSIGAGWKLLAEAYYQNLKNLVVADGRTSARVTNEGSGFSYGADLVLSRLFNNGWSANVLYSYNQAKRDNNDGQGEYDSDFNRAHYFAAGGAWEINERWKIAARWKYATGRSTDDFIVNDDVLGDGLPLRFSKELTDRNALRLDNYHSLNVRVDYRRPLGPVDLIAFLDVINVYAGPNQTSEEFDPKRGVNIEQKNSPFPLFGLIFERTW